MNLCDALESKRFLNGQMIIVQGDQANGMYFIESGVSSSPPCCQLNASLANLYYTSF